MPQMWAGARRVSRVSTALYRRYRPDTFEDVIGQDHVTLPLRAALKANKVSHAYLFSGPRGCGKTTSARILARCLNCVQGPTDTPCGQCASCRELATGGPGSLDVVEMDAASHGGVDDARDLRERAAFAPVRDRFKIFIIDEAHMVTSQGFNALLKLVEEPPDHVKFIFATTEPDKVLNTIRSRTHHYPFRLVPPDVLQPFLQHLCDAEHVRVDDGVLGLVMRAGSGSVRDTLSVLDQLMAGAIDGALDYQQTVTLLGYTDTALLDQTVEALAQGDGAGAYRVIERMVDSGHDPRRFVEDFLQRLRDLMIIAVAGEQATQVLTGTPVDQLQRMHVQADTWGGAALSRAADLTDQALRTMVGATSPRLQLELLIGRILVPSQVADISIPQGAQAPLATPSGRAVNAGGPSSVSATSPVDLPVSQSDEHFGAEQAKEQVRRALHPDQETPRVPAEARPSRPLPDTPLVPTPSAGYEQPRDNEAVEVDSPSARPFEARTQYSEVPKQPAPVTASVSHHHQTHDIADQIRRRWPEIVDALETIARVTWNMVTKYGQLGEVSERSVVVLLPSQGQKINFEQHQRARDIARAIEQVVSVRVEVYAEVGHINRGTTPPPAPRSTRGSAQGVSAPHHLGAGAVGAEQSARPTDRGTHDNQAVLPRRNSASSMSGRSESKSPYDVAVGQSGDIAWAQPVAPVSEVLLGGGEDPEPAWTEPVAPVPFSTSAAVSEPAASHPVEEWPEPVAVAADEGESTPKTDLYAEPEAPIPPQLVASEALPVASPVAVEAEREVAQLDTKTSTSTFRTGLGGRTLQVVSNDEPEEVQEPELDETLGEKQDDAPASVKRYSEAVAEVDSLPQPQQSPRIQAADDESASPDDEDADMAPNIGLPAVLSILGGKIIEEKEE